MSNAGFAGSTDFSASSDALVFTLPSVQRTLRAEGSPRFERQDVVLFVDTQTLEVSVDLNGRRVALDQDVSNVNAYRYDAGGDLIILDFFDSTGGTFAANLFSVQEGEMNDGFVIGGFDTLPDIVANQTGTAVYRGAAEFTLRRESFLDAFGSGDASLTVDFDQQTIKGELATTERSNSSEFGFPPLTVTLAETGIQQNGFSGDATLSDNGLGASHVDGGFEGRIYGPEAQVAAGTFWSIFDVDAFEDPVLLNGYFLTSDVSP